jgi:hypothetical protein
MDKYLVTALVWGLGASLDLQHRKELCAFIASRHHVTLPSGGLAAGGDICALDCFADVQTGNWRLWQELVPATDVPSHAVLQADAVVPTLDTVRHVVRGVVQPRAVWLPRARHPSGCVGGVGLGWGGGLGGFSLSCPLMS